MLTTGAMGLSPADVAEWVTDLGVWGPILLGGLIALEGVIAPIPGWFFVAASGLLYGFWGGLALAWTSAMAGAIIAFFLAHRLGRQLMLQHIPKSIASIMDDITTQNGFLILLTARIVPITALDLLSYAAGLAGMRFRPFFAATALGFLPGTIALVTVGDQATAFARLDYLLYVTVSLVVAIGIVRKWMSHHRRLSGSSE